MYFSKTKAPTAKMRSQVCSARKPTALAAVLKRKLTICPISPGSREASFAAISLSPPAIAFPVAFKPLVRALITVPIVTPAASRIAVKVMPFFLNISLTLSRRGMKSSLSTIWVCSRAISSILSSILSLAASFSEVDMSVASMIA